MGTSSVVPMRILNICIQANEKVRSAQKFGEFIVAQLLILWFIAEVTCPVSIKDSAATTVLDISGVVARRFQTEPRASFQHVLGTCNALEIDLYKPPSLELHGRAQLLACRSNTPV